MATITASNVIFMLSVSSVVTTSQQLQQFAADDAFLSEAVDAAEVQVGVDGFGVAGYVPRAPIMPIRFLASSPSVTIFENWIEAQDQLGDVLYAQGSLTYPSVSRKYTLYQGTLMRVQTVPDARRVLGPREFRIQWLPQGTIPAITSSPT